MKPLAPIEPPKMDTPVNATPVDGDPWAFECDMITAGPGNPGNKYYYPPEWVNDALTAKLYNGAQCFIDHDGFMDQENRPERSMKDLLGYWSRVRAEGNALKGRINIVPSEANRPFRDQIATSIEYRKKFPDKNFCGFSVVQRGDTEPMKLEGEEWKKVIRTTAVKSCDLVTLPARGGQANSQAGALESLREEATKWVMESMATMEKEMKESGQSASAMAVLTLPAERPGKEAVGSESEDGPLPALVALRDKVAAAGEDMPMKHELRRGLDQAISAYQKQSEGGKKMPNKGAQVPTAHPDQDGDESEAEAQSCAEAAEAFQKMAEAESEAGKKAGFQKQAEGMKKMAEAKRQKMAEAKKKKEAEEAEAKAKEAEAKGKEDETESLREFVTDNLMREAEFPENVTSFVKKQLVGKTIAQRRQIIEDAKGTLMRESVAPINPPKQVARTGSEKSKAELSSVLKEC